MPNMRHVVTGFCWEEMVVFRGWKEGALDRLPAAVFRRPEESRYPGYFSPLTGLTVIYRRRRPTFVSPLFACCLPCGRTQTFEVIQTHDCDLHRYLPINVV